MSRSATLIWSYENSSGQTEESILLLNPPYNEQGQIVSIKAAKYELGLGSVIGILGRDTAVAICTLYALLNHCPWTALFVHVRQLAAIRHLSQLIPLSEGARVNKCVNVSGGFLPLTV